MYALELQNIHKYGEKHIGICKKKTDSSTSTTAGFSEINLLNHS